MYAPPAPSLEGSAILPAQNDPRCWDNVYLLPLEHLECTGPWALHRWYLCPGMPRALHTTAEGAHLRLNFDGRGLVLGFDFGRGSGEMHHRMDGGAWIRTRRKRPSWCEDHGWFHLTVVADDLPRGRHSLELETMHASADGVHTTLGLAGVIR